MSLFSALNIALTGLNTNMTQMQVVANNIANANNEGYTKKTAVSQALVLGQEGGGTFISQFTRAANDVLSTTLNLAVSDYGLRNTQSKYLEQLQNILGSDNNSNPPLSDAISKFAAAWRQLEAAPESNVNQSQVIQTGTNLVNLIQSISRGVDDLDKQCWEDINSTIKDLNGYLISIVDINRKISQGIGIGEDVSNLMDQRDVLVQKVANVTNIKIMQRNLGQIAIYTPGGYMLVDGDCQTFSYDGTKVTSALDEGLSLNNALTGGKLQALVDFRARATAVSANPAVNVIQKIKSQLNAIVSALTTVSLGPPQSFASAYNGVAEASQANCITFQCKYSGTFGNGITVAISAGTAPGTQKATIHVNGGTDEVFDNIAGTGNTFWVNLADAINNGQAGPPPVAASRYITATAGTGATAPAASYTLSGGSGNVTNGTASNSLLSNGFASATVQNNCLNLIAKTAGTDGNSISMSIANGSGAGLYTITITDGTNTEVYTDIDDGGGGNAFWVNVADAINNGGGTPLQPASLLVTATAGIGTAAPTVPSSVTLAGGGDVTSTCLNFFALNSGLAGNNISVTLSTGTNAGTYKVTVSAPGYLTETYDNLDNSGSGLWKNITDAINASSKIIMATAGSAVSLPTVPKSFALSGGTKELLTGFFTGTTTSSFAVNSGLLDGTYTLKVSGIGSITDTFNDSSKTFTADGLSVTGQSYESLATSILTGFQQATTNTNLLASAASDQQDYLKLRISNETGVNVDRETISLTTLQNAYAASAHVIQVINKLFDILEGI